MKNLIMNKENSMFDQGIGLRIATFLKETRDVPTEKEAYILSRIACLKYSAQGYLHKKGAIIIVHATVP
jgi:hypothetical protein